MRDLVGGAIVLAFSLAMLAVTASIRDPGYDSLGPAFVPRLALWVLVAASVGIIIRGWLGWRRTAVPAAAALAAPTDGRSDYLVRVLATTAFMAAYLGALGARVPFELATAVFIGALGFGLGLRGRQLLLLAALAIGTALLVGYVFKALLFVNLP